MKTLRLIITLLFVSPVAVHAGDWADEYRTPLDNFDTSEYQQQIESIEQYLSNFDTLSSRFSQSLPDKVTMSYGTVHISRPGKARWEYTAPHKTLMIVKDGRISYWDKDLDQITYADLPENPLEVLLKKDIQLSGDIQIVDFHETLDTMTIVLASGGKEEQKYRETLSLEFGKNPIQLLRILRTDPANKTVTMRLIDPTFDKPLDDELFVFKNPRIFNRKPRK